MLSGTLLFGWMLDTLFASYTFEMRRMVHQMEGAGFVGQISAVLLLILSWKVILPARKSSGCFG